MNIDGFQALFTLLYVGLPTLVVGSVVYFVYRGVQSTSYQDPVGPVHTALPPSRGDVGRRIDPRFSTTALSIRLQRVIIEAFAAATSTSTSTSTTTTTATSTALAPWVKPAVLDALRARHDGIASVDSVGITRVHAAHIKHDVTDDEERLVVRVEVVVARDVHRVDGSALRLRSREEWTVSRPILTDDVARAGDMDAEVLGCPGCGDAIDDAADVDGLQVLVDRRRCSACGCSLVVGARDWGVDDVRVLSERADAGRDLASSTDDVVVHADSTARATLVAASDEGAAGELLSHVREGAAELHRAFHARDRDGIAARTRAPLRRRLLHALRDERDERRRPSNDVVADATLLRFEVDGPWHTALLQVDGVAPLPRFWTFARRADGSDAWLPLALNDGDELARG